MLKRIEDCFILQFDYFFINFNQTRENYKLQFRSLFEYILNLFYFYAILFD